MKTRLLFLLLAAGVLLLAVGAGRCRACDGSHLVSLVNDGW